MCGRISLFAPPSVLEARFDAETARRIPPRYNVAPGDDLAVIRNSSGRTGVTRGPTRCQRGVNDPDNDSPAVTEPVDAGTQSGLDDFG